MRFSIRSPAAAWPTGWILPLRRPATASSGAPAAHPCPAGPRPRRGPVAFDGSGHDLRSIARSPPRQITISRAPELP